MKWNSFLVSKGVTTIVSAHALGTLIVNSSGEVRGKHQYYHVDSKVCDVLAHYLVDLQLVLLILDSCGILLVVDLLL